MMLLCDHPHLLGQQHEQGQYLPDFSVITPKGSHYYLEVKPPLDIEQVNRTAAQMEIIWDSEPKTRLVIDCSDGDDGILWDGCQLRNGSAWTRYHTRFSGFGFSIFRGVHFADDGLIEVLSDGSEYVIYPHPQSQEAR